MEKAIIIFAEKSGKRDLYYFLLGAWSSILPQLLFLL